MTLQTGKVSVSTVEASRKRLRELRKKHPASLKGQLTFCEVVARDFEEKVKWKGGFTRLKNVPENWEE